MEWSASRSGRFITGSHWIWGWVDPRASLDAVAKRKSSSPYRESNRGRSARSQVTVL